jgi:hypothetical protein
MTLMVYTAEAAVLVFQPLTAATAFKVVSGLTECSGPGCALAASTNRMAGGGEYRGYLAENS